MNRPLVIRQILSHVSRRCVVPFRLRTVDADRLTKYVEHLEANQRSTGAKGSTGDVVGSFHPSVSLEPEERVLAAANAPPEPGTHADDCSLHPGHTGACVAFMSA